MALTRPKAPIVVVLPQGEAPPSSPPLADDISRPGMVGQPVSDIRGQAVYGVSGAGTITDPALANFVPRRVSESPTDVVIKKAQKLEDLFAGSAPSWVNTALTSVMQRTALGQALNLKSNVDYKTLRERASDPRPSFAIWALDNLRLAEAHAKIGLTGKYPSVWDVTVAENRLKRNMNPFDVKEKRLPAPKVSESVTPQMNMSPKGELIDLRTKSAGRLGSAELVGQSALKAFEVLAPLAIGGYMATRSPLGKAVGSNVMKSVVPPLIAWLGWEKVGSRIQDWYDKTFGSRTQTPVINNYYQGDAALPPAIPEKPTEPEPLTPITPTEVMDVQPPMDWAKLFGLLAPIIRYAPVNQNQVSEGSFGGGASPFLSPKRRKRKKRAQRTTVEVR